MAFNPFSIFRRNQKILFSILTIVVMFMFVLSFGRGDFFDKVPRWLGSKRHTGEVMAVVDGDKVYASDFGAVTRKRTLANRYMSLAGAKASENLAKYATEGTPRVSSENREIVKQATQVHQQLTMFGSRMQITAETLAFLEQILGIRQTQDALAGIVNGKSPKEDDLDIAKVAQTLLNLDLQLIAGKKGHYFSNQPGETNRDTMNFVLWSKKAKGMGVEFRDDDIKVLVKDEFSGKVSDDELKEISDGMKGSVQGYTPEMLTEALVEEFKVRAAQEALMGRSIARANGVGYASPYDYYQFYKDQCSTARYGMISIPTENYLDKVTETPSDAEIQEIFRKHRNDEPNPALSRPGLKEPRKLKLEWIEVTGSEPHYKAAADTVISQGEAFAVLAPYLALSSSLGGVTTAGQLAVPTTVAGKDLFTKSKYEDYKREQQVAARASWFSPPSVFLPQKPLDSSMTQPTGIVALAGILGGGFASGGSPFAAPATLVGTSYAADRKARLLAMQAALIAPASPAIGAFGYSLTVAASLGAAVQPLPLNAVKPALTEKAKDDTARFLASEDLTKLQLELAKLKVEKNNSIAGEKARELVDAFAKSRGVKRGESTEFRDLYTIANDPGLAPLKEKHDIAEQFRTTFADPTQFGQRFFLEQDPSTGQTTASTALYRLQSYPQTSFAAPAKGESLYAVWRSAELPAEAPRDPKAPAVQAKAIAAWRRQKARVLAKQAAEDLAKQSGNLGKNFLEIKPKLRDKAAQFGSQFPGLASAKVRYFEIDDVAPLVSRPLPTAQRNAPAAPFTLTPSFNVPHPSPKMTEELIATRDKPPSTSVVLTDAAEDVYYVATLLGRDDRSADEFGLMVYGPFATFGGDLAPTIARKHQDDVRKHSYETALALLKSEFKYEKEHDDVSKKKDAGEE